MISRNIKQKEVKPYTGDRINKKSINKLREELETKFKELKKKN